MLTSCHWPQIWTIVFPIFLKKINVTVFTVVVSERGEGGSEGDGRGGAAGEDGPRAAAERAHLARVLTAIPRLLRQEVRRILLR